MAISRRRAAAIGNFDGVHRGHRFLVEQTIAFARDADASPAVVVFDPHPRRYFRPDDPPFLLTTPETRNALLLEAGAEAVLPLAFDRALASLTPEAFVRDVLKRRLALTGVVTGKDFRFGAGRAGDAARLSKLCAEYGLKYLVVEPISDPQHTDKIGSTAIREALMSGAVDRAAAMLGRPWRVDGVVSHGRQIGRTLGFATANLTLGALIEPRRAVYAVRATVDGQRYDAVANFGRKPTVGEVAPLLEVHLFDFTGDLYGKTIGVDFIAFLRDERKFDGLPSLKAQIAADCVDAQRRLSEDAARRA
ncbi:MAG: bifunctional riboflavin kinase/FAD synthetase [Parvularculaceae bacterium]|nr:bifunctional riboflavin kinase/FAD synthetase [Parvularculaceae bacterium]